MKPFFLAELVINNVGRLTLGKTRSQGKMKMFRLMQKNSVAVCDFLKDFGEFEFRWEKGVWAFYDQANRYIGSANYFRDRVSEKKFKDAQRREQQKAYDASQQ